MSKPVYKARYRSSFYNHYLKKSVVELLEDYGFFVQECPNDMEDVVYFENRKKFILENIGLPDIPWDVKKEFSAEYQLTEITSVFIEGGYSRKLTGEKLYSWYTYNFYKQGCLPDGRIIKTRFYAENVNKVKFLEVFEQQILMFQKEGYVGK